MKAAAIIAAAGEGLRMKNAIRKQYLVLEEKPVLVRSMQLFLDHRAVTEIIIVVPPGEQGAVSRLLQPYCQLDEIKLVEGGSSRQESVGRGLKAVSEEAGLVCIHDAARPLASADLLDALLDTASEKAGSSRGCGSAVPVIPLNDTVKEVDRDGFVLSTPARDSLSLVQTPQVFRREIILDAYSHAAANDFEATDDASLVEAMGRPVKTVSGELNNFKITSPLDLMLASLLLKGAEYR